MSGYYGGAYAPRGAVLGAGDCGLAYGAAPGVQLLRFMLVPLLPAHEGLVYLDRAGHREAGAINEPLPDALHQVPCGRLADTEVAVNLHARRALDAGRHQIDRDYPFLEPQLARLHDSPLDPGTGRRSPKVRVEPPAHPPNIIRNRRRAPALPDLSPDPTLDRSARANTRSSAPAILLPEPERGVLEAVARAVAEIEERTTVFPETEVQALALGHAPGRYTLAEIDAAIAALVRDGELVEAERRGADRAFVTDRALGLERQIVKTMRAGRGEGRTLADARVVEARLSRTGLTQGQRDAVEAIARSSDWLIGIQGHAGAGKTTMLREAAELPGMPRVRGLAPSSSAVRALEREAGIEARTLQWFLTRFDDLSDAGRLAQGREMYAGTVLTIDEASMIGTVQMDALLRTARALDVARVVLVGDTRQLRAVDAGQPFRVLQRAGMATTVMDEVLRQRDPRLAAAVAHARDGHPELALRTLGERVHKTPRELLGEAAGRVWLALPPEARATTAVLAPTHAIRREIHDTIREGLSTEGALDGRALTIERLIDRRLTRAEPPANSDSLKPNPTSPTRPIDR